MKLQEMQNRVAELQKDIGFLDRMMATKACRTCTSFDRGMCRVANLPPPDHVQPVGCPEWDWDECPF